MKLTNSMRDSFINKVINGLDNIDYISKAQELFNKDAYDKLPENLKNKDTQHYLESKRIYFSEFSCLGSYYVRNKEYEASDEVRAKVKELHDLHAEQRDKKEKVREQLRAIIYNATTLKKAIEIVPAELHKYLPKEEEKASNNYALVSNELLGDLKSLGFK